MKIKNTITLTMFIVITIILQIFSSYINIAGFPITLSLIPIIIGGAMYGISYGIILGLSFGVVVSIMVITGLDPTGATMLSIHPIITIAICLIKGMLAGLLSSLLYKSIKNKTIAIFASAIIAPITNTVSLLIVLVLFFNKEFGTILSTLISINFLIEILVNIILAPSLLTIINRKH